MTSSSSHQQAKSAFTFDGFAEELAGSSYPKKGGIPAPIGSQKSRRPPPGFEQKVPEPTSTSGISVAHDNNSTKPDVVNNWYSPCLHPSSQGQPQQGDSNAKDDHDEMNQFFMAADRNRKNNSGDNTWNNKGSKAVGDRHSRNSSGKMSDTEQQQAYMAHMQNIFAMPGPHGDNGAPHNQGDSPSNSMFAFRTPNVSGGSNSSMGSSGNAMMQNFMSMVSQNPAMSHMFNPMNPMMNMNCMNPAMMQAMMNMMVSMNQFQNMANMNSFMQHFQKWANSGQFPPNMESMINHLNINAKEPQASKPHNKNSLDNNSSNVNSSSSPNSSFDSDSKVKMSPRTQERLTTVYGEINSTKLLVERLNLELNVNKDKLEIPRRARYFIIKSFTEEDVHRAVKYKMWCSTYYGNRRLESAYDNMKKSYGNDGDIILFFSVNASGHFCGVARMTSRYDADAKEGADVWCRDEHNEGGKNSKWRGNFSIEWIYIKDIPNTEFTHLRVTKNGGKPFPHSRDTQEIESNIAEQAIRIFHVHKQKTSLLDDFDHYNRMEERQHVKERVKSYKYINDARKDSGNGRSRSGTAASAKAPTGRRDSAKSGGGRRGSYRGRSNSEQDSVGDSTIKGVIMDEKSTSRSAMTGGARNPEYERDAMPQGIESEKESANVFEEMHLPGVLSKLKPDSVTKILAANGPLGIKNGGKFVPVDEQINSSQNMEKVSRKVPGQPGPNAIPIVKPKDHESNKSRSASSTPEKLAKILGGGIARKEKEEKEEQAKDEAAQTKKPEAVEKSEGIATVEAKEDNDTTGAVKDKKDDEITDAKKDELSDKKMSK